MDKLVANRTNRRRNKIQSRAASERGPSWRYLPIAALVFIISLVLPNYFFLGLVRLTPNLLVILILFSPMTLRWFSKKTIEKTATDLFVALFCFWGAVSLAYHHGIENSVETVAVLTLQTFGSYIIGKVAIRNASHFKSLIELHFLILAVMLPFGLIEAFTKIPVWLNLFDVIAPTWANVPKPPRLGLDQVQGPFEHPILYGVFCMSLFAATVTATRRLRSVVWRWAIISTATLISLSSGALLGMVVQVMTMAWGRLLRTNPHKWALLFAVAVCAYIVIDLLSNRTPFDVVVSYLTFSSGNSYNRILIWQFGTAEVWRHPILGIGLNEWTRPSWMGSSMDNFWLLHAVRYGIPGFLLLVLSLIWTLWRIGRNSTLEGQTAAIRTGFVVSMVGVLFAISTVHLWNATYGWLFFLIGGASWMTQPQSPSDDDDTNLPATGRAPKYKKARNPWARR